MTNNRFATESPPLDGEIIYDPSVSTDDGTLPAGDYLAEIIDTNVSPPRNGDGKMLNLTWRISTGDYEGQYIFSHWPFLHSSSQAMMFARRKISMLCEACKIEDIVTDPEILKGNPCLVHVVKKEDKAGQYPPANEITRISRMPSPLPQGTRASNNRQPAARQAGGPGQSAWSKPKKTASEIVDDEVPF